MKYQGVALPYRECPIYGSCNARKMAENENNRHYGHFSIFSKFVLKYQFMFYDDIISNL